MTARWNATPTWIDVDTIPMFAGARAMARARDEPFAHPYEPWNRTLARAARDHGARVMLDGSGGDQLFQVSGVYLADLFRTGQWIELVRQWRARGGTGAREFAKACIRPLLSDNALELLDALVGGGASRHYLDRAPSPWFRSTFLAREGVLDSERAHRPPLPRSSVVLAETHAFLRYPFFPRVAARVAAYVLDEGVQARSPLLDRRVVAFAAARPWYERVNRNDTKMLLRRSMKGLLPDSVLAPRAYRTGITSGYFRRSLTGTGRELIESLIDARHLADSGAVDPKTLRRAWEYYLETGDEETGVRILFTAQTELWLREHLTPGEGSG